MKLIGMNNLLLTYSYPASFRPSLTIWLAAVRIFVSLILHPNAFQVFHPKAGSLPCAQSVQSNQLWRKTYNFMFLYQCLGGLHQKSCNRDRLLHLCSLTNENSGMSLVGCIKWSTGVSPCYIAWATPSTKLISFTTPWYSTVSDHLSAGLFLRWLMHLIELWHPLPRSPEVHCGVRIQQVQLKGMLSLHFPTILDHRVGNHDSLGKFSILSRKTILRKASMPGPLFLSPNRRSKVTLFKPGVYKRRPRWRVNSWHPVGFASVSSTVLLLCRNARGSDEIVHLLCRRTQAFSRWLTRGSTAGLPTFLPINWDYLIYGNRVLIINSFLIFSWNKMSESRVPNSVRGDTVPVLYLLEVSLNSSLDCAFRVGNFFFCDSFTPGSLLQGSGALIVILLLISGPGPVGTEAILP